VVHRLFEPFQRLDRTRVDNHHGLGLSIVRAIAIAHDATLTATVRAQGDVPIEIQSLLIPFAMPRSAASETLERPASGQRRHCCIGGDRRQAARLPP
jgi:signal transduction histidine kinase